MDSVLAIAVLSLALLSILLTCLHPVSPLLLAVFLFLVMARFVWHSPSWLLVLPALLPIFSFAPWTGWWLIGEWDLLVLAVLVSGYGRILWDRRSHGPQSEPSTGSLSPSFVEPLLNWGVYLILTAVVVLFAWRGWALSDQASFVLPSQAQDGWSRWASLWTLALHGDYGQAWNALRVSLPFVWALLLWPLLRHAHRHDAEGVKRLFARGMLIGLALVCAWVVWERLAYVGLFDFTLPYRTTAGFWEMHVGGGAIDAYLAMTVPFAFWALWTAPSGWRWWMAACLAFWALYAVLATYSRGVLGAVALALLFLAWLAWHGRIGPAHGLRAHRVAWAGLALLLVAEVFLAVGGGNFLAKRLAQSESDLKGRWAHWTAGVGLLQSPYDWLFGLGAGRLPAQYSQQVPGADFVGRVQWQHSLSSAPAVVLSGPAHRAEIAEDFGFSQRVPLQSGGAYTVRLKALNPRPVSLMLRVCEQHLLYAMQCQVGEARLPVSAETQDWLSYALSGPELGTGTGRELWRAGLFSVTVLGAGREIQLQAVELLDPLGRQVLSNTRFSTGMQHWFSVASNHFQPWHIDNLYLDLLIERGLLGLLIFFALLAGCLAVLRKGLLERQRHAGVFSASVLAGLVLGLVISFTELPRVTILLLLVLMVSSLPARHKAPG